MIGGNLARLFAQAGHHVLLSFARSAGKLDALAAEIGPNARVGTPADAVQFGEVVVLSVHFTAMDTAIAQMGDATGKILVDTNNAYEINLPAGMTAADEVLRRIPGVRLVKAFNTLVYSDLLSKSHHQPPYALPFAGDDEEANEQVASLIFQIGFTPLQTGSLAQVAWQEVGGPLYGQALTPEQARSLVAEARGKQITA